jgi:arylsulfatase
MSERMKKPHEYAGFAGRIGRTVAESEPAWIERPHPGTGAPNVVFVLFDDLGFSQFGCYGSTIDTPNIDRLAQQGLQYTNFHVTPLCSPTRASLLTGRNHHAVGMRSVSNFSTGFPHMRGSISPHAATIAEVLRDTGYATFALGKWHLCPMTDASAAGPFDQWPLQRGFDRYYGFLDGETDQFHPELVYDNHWIDPPARPEDGYHLTEDLVDKAVEFVHDSVSLRPDRPFFMYFALGATHAPHQAPKRSMEKYRGKFDEGWDVIRQRWFDNQKRLGLIPAETVLAPRNPGVEAWDDLSENQRRLACRLQEAFAAFLDHTDEQIGRLVAALERLNVADNTIFVLLADNGASQEGGPFGVLHEMKFFNFLIETPDEAIHRIDDIGGPHSHSNYPWGWAQAGNAPFKWYKQNVHEGGVHVPLIVRWPEGIATTGLRDQFHHVNDLVPTIYEVLGVTPPATYRGYEQMPVTGTSLAYTFASSDLPSRKAVQYFEMVGHRAIYHQGWKAVTRHQPGTSFDDDTWELYHVEVDRSEVFDLASQEPERLRALIDLWWVEAEKEGVLPLDDRGVELFGARFADRTVHPTSRRYVYRPPMSPLPAQASAAIAGRSWDMQAAISRELGDDGVIYATGTENSGLSLFLLGDQLVLDYNCFGEHQILESTATVPSGACEVGVRFRREGRAGRVTLVVNGVDVGEMVVPFAMRMFSSVGPSVGYDHGSPVSDLYRDRRDGFPFSGELEYVEIALVSPSPQVESEVQAVEKRSGFGRQ